MVFEELEVLFEDDELTDEVLDELDFEEIEEEIKGCLTTD